MLLRREHGNRVVAGDRPPVYAISRSRDTTNCLPAHCTRKGSKTKLERILPATNPPPGPIRARAAAESRLRSRARGGMPAVDNVRALPLPPMRMPAHVQGESPPGGIARLA